MKPKPKSIPARKLAQGYMKDLATHPLTPKSQEWRAIALEVLISLLIDIEGQYTKI